MKKENSEKTTNELLLFIYKKRIILLITALVAGIASIIYSLMIPVLYESSAVVFPAATSTVSFSEQRNAKAGAMDFGEEESAEQLIQILQSSRVRNRIISQFNLAKVYDLDPEKSHFNYKLGEEYSDHISFERTRYGSVSISVLDETPELASKIANKIVQLIDTVKNELIKERTIPAFQINKRKLDELKVSLDDLVTEMDSLSQLGVVNAEARANLFSAMNKATNPKDKDFFRNQINVNQNYGSRYDALADLREFRIERMTEQEVSYEQSESDANENFNHKFIVEKAYPSDKKAKPKRMIIVLVSTIAAIVFMLIVLLIKSRLSDLKKSI